MKHIIDGAFISMLEARELQMQKPMRGFFGGMRQSKTYGSSVEFADYREYMAGDDLRRIDWNIYTRFQKLYLRLYHDERQFHHRIYLDGSASMAWGKPEKGELALRLAAALSYLSVKSLDRVSVHVIHGDKAENLSGTVVGRQAFYKAADLLNGVDFFGESELDKAILSAENVGHDDGLSVIISDFFTESDWKNAVDYLLFRGREVHLIQVVSPDELSPTLSGKLQLLDREAPTAEDSRHYMGDIGRAAKKAYDKAFLWHQNDIRQFCESRGVGFFSVSTHQSIEEMLFLKATEARLIK